MDMFLYYFPPDIYLIHRHDILNMRLGWPSQNKGLETLKWLARVRAKTLEDRRAPR